MEFKEVESKNFWKPEDEGDYIIGKYVQLDRNVGTNNSNLYHIDISIKDGEAVIGGETQDMSGIVKVWGSAVLNDRMGSIPMDAIVKIAFDGRGEKKGGHAAPYLFKVFQATKEQGENEEEVSEEDIPK